MLAAPSPAFVSRGHHGLLKLLPRADSVELTLSRRTPALTVRSVATNRGYRVLMKPSGTKSVPSPCPEMQRADNTLELVEVLKMS